MCMYTTKQRTLILTISSLSAFTSIPVPCRQHDLRLSLNRYETVPKGDETVQKLLSTVKMHDPETLQLVPCADDWVVNFIRHKKRETFFMEGKYMVTVTTVKEHNVNWKEMRPGDSTVVKPKDYNEPHMEVEVRPVLTTYLCCLHQTICQPLSTDKCICWPILHSLRVFPSFVCFRLCSV